MTKQEQIAALERAINRLKLLGFAKGPDSVCSGLKAVLASLRAEPSAEQEREECGGSEMRMSVEFPLVEKLIDDCRSYGPLYDAQEEYILIACRQIAEVVRMDALRARTVSPAPLVPTEYAMPAPLSKFCAHLYDSQWIVKHRDLDGAFWIELDDWSLDPDDASRFPTPEASAEAFLAAQKGTDDAKA